MTYSLFSDAHFAQFIIACTMPQGREGYMYLLAPKNREEDLLAALDKGDIPAYAVVVSAGTGKPDEQTQHHMERCYGFKTHTPNQYITCNLQHAACPPSGDGVFV